MKNYLSKILFAFVLITLSQSISAQTEEQDDGLSKRDATANVFLNNRPSGVKTTTTQKRYRKGVVKKPRKIKPSPYKPPVKEAPIQQLGVTMWRLRNEKSGEAGARLLIQGSGSKLVAQRVSIETLFLPKDKVRLSIESPVSGYLYVFDRELGKGCKITDGKLDKDCRYGEPYMIFPTLSTRNGDNRVSAGMLVEIPAQTDDPFYFEITPQSDDYSGEFLTVIVSPTKLPNLEAQNGPVKISTATIEKWEDDWEEDTVADELETPEGLYTVSEQQAGAGKKNLTQNDPPPQTRFAFKVTKGKPFLISFPMLVAN